MKGLSVSSKGESSVLRDLHKTQISIPDKDFLANVKKEFSRSKPKRSKGGIFSGGLFGGKKTSKIDLEIAREKIKSFNNSFKQKNKKLGPHEIIEPGLMSVQEMKDYRGAVKASADEEEEGFAYRGLEGIVKFIDLRNSGVSTNKQEVLLDCLKKLTMALNEDGGLSMFHSTWFLSIYKEYLAHYRMFRKGEFERASQGGGKEARTIAKGLLMKQYELPHYLQLVSDDKRDVKQLLRYSKDPYVKRSLHGQKGCNGQHIKKVFHDYVQSATSKPGKTNEPTFVNEVNIIMSYALFFSRIPMMQPLVGHIANSIPNLGLETTLYREKIMISQKLIRLEILSGVGKNDGSDVYLRKLYGQASEIYRQCISLIVDNRLTADSIKSDIHTFPFLRQAIVLIAHKQVFMKQKKPYLKMLENSLELLETLSDAARSGKRSVLRIIEYVDVYARNLEAIIHQVKSELSD